MSHPFTWKQTAALSALAMALAAPLAARADDPTETTGVTVETDAAAETTAAGQPDSEAPDAAMTKDAATPSGAAAEATAEARASAHVAAGTDVEEIVVTATRRREPLATVARSVTVISRDEVQDAVALAHGNLGDALGKLVPGLAAGGENQSVFGQTLRGRQMLVLIDGIPQLAIRNVSRDLQTIAPAAIERIEVLRGTSALYGEGAAGGIIHIVTKRPPTDGEVQVTTDVGVAAQPLASAASTGGHLAQTIASKRGRLDYTIVGSVDHVGALFDGEGDRIPPDPHGQGGLAEVWGFNGLARIGFDLDADQRIEIGGNHYRNLQNTDYTFDPAVADEPARTTKSRARVGLDIAEPVANENSLVSVTYRHADVLGGELSAQVYARDFLARFFPFDARSYAAYGHQIIQSRLESRRLGARVEATTPLPHRLSLLWGVDASLERSSQPVSIIDPAAYDSTGGLVFNITGERGWVPPMNVANAAPFAQLSWRALPRLRLRAGARQELITLSVDDYTTLAGNDIQGGDLRFARTLFDGGALVDVAGGVQTFVSVTQGYSLPDVGLILRNAPMGATVESLNTDPQRVTSTEVGLRRHGRHVSAEVAAFYSTSDLGTSTGGFMMPVVRAPERVYGLEAAAELRLAGWELGSSVTWIEGKLDKMGNGEYTYLNSYRIPPLKITGQVGRELLPGWRARVGAVYSGERDRFPGSTAFGERPVDDYVLLDVDSSLDVGPGRLRVGVANLLDQQYMPIPSQLLRSGTNTSHAAGAGLTASVGYTVRY